MALGDLLGEGEVGIGRLDGVDDVPLGAGQHPDQLEQQDGDNAGQHAGDNAEPGRRHAIDRHDVAPDLRTARCAERCGHHYSFIRLKRRSGSRQMTAMIGSQMVRT